MRQQAGEEEADAPARDGRGDRGGLSARDHERRTADSKLGARPAEIGGRRDVLQGAREAMVGQRGYLGLVFRVRKDARSSRPCRVEAASVQGRLSRGETE